MNGLRSGGCWKNEGTGVRDPIMADILRDRIDEEREEKKARDIWGTLS